MPELLLELLSEEIPARMQVRAAEDLKRLVCDGLKKAKLDFDRAQAFVTPRRLALVIDGIPEKQPDISEERRGPRADAPEKAVEGFKRGLPKGSKIETRETEKGAFYFAMVENNGASVRDIIFALLPEFVRKLQWQKSMRWGSSDLRWVRPIRSIVYIFNGKSFDGFLNDKGFGSRDLLKDKNLAPGNIPVGNITIGHPFLAPKPFEVTDFHDYVHKLREAKVILDHQERCQIIGSAALTLAEEAGLELKEDHDLLHEVAGLVEWPVALMGSIDEAFMELPDEVLTTVMRHHQKYFALLDEKGLLAPRFVVVANTETEDEGKAVTAGNERVLKARLADARFFWDQDLKQTLESRVQELGGRVFHAKLGTVLDKVLRVEQLAGELAGACGADAGDAMRAANLAKADLSTEMVAEFPELQGVIGRYYALSDGEKPEVADAIADHYSPLGPNDACPQAPISVAVALADKVDTLVFFWKINEKPTGSKDPFALRRAALGAIRLIIDNKLRLHLSKFFRQAWMVKGELESGVSDSLIPDPIVDDLLNFLAERLKVHLRKKGVRHDHIDAVFAVQKPGGGKEDDLVRLLKRVEALGAFLGTDDGENLLVAYKRAGNIVRIEEKNDAKSYDREYKINLLATEEEKKLATYLDEARSGATEALADEDFTAAMSVIARLRPPVDDFFDHVTVNCDDADLRENRLRLLSRIDATLDQVADFSRIEGGER